MRSVHFPAALVRLRERSNSGTVKLVRKPRGLASSTEPTNAPRIDDPRLKPRKLLAARRRPGFGLLPRRHGPDERHASRRRRVTLAAVPFGASSAPSFDGAIGSRLTIPSSPQYSQPFAKALTVAVWICPLALDNASAAGSPGGDQYVHFLEKAVTPLLDTEWAMRLYNQDNPERHSRLSFYMFNLRSTTTNRGAGSYMEFDVSTNDATPVVAGSWLFLVGEAEPWISKDDQTTGCILWKQDVEAKRIPQDKYEYPEFQVQPQAANGPLSVG
jgi:hypothetical protein